MILTELRPSQQEAVERALPFDGFLLFMEQRTGKCLTSLALVDKRKPRYLWIVCPVPAIDVWKKQIKEHLKVDWECTLILMNFEELANKKKRRKYYQRMREIGDQCYLIGDELHRCKRRGTSWSRSLRHIAKMARWRLGLTGTPMDKGIHDLWAQFNFADPEIFGPFESELDDKGRIVSEGFKDKYLLYGGFRGLKIIGSKNEEEFYEIAHRHSYRITLREARGKERPLKLRFRKEMVNLDEWTRGLYEQLEEELEAEVNKKRVKARVVIALAMKLQQLCGGFVMTEEGPEVVGSDKLRRLIKLVRELKERRKKFVVVCRFLYEIERIRARLASRGITTQVVCGGKRFDPRFREDGVIIQIQSALANDMSAADDMFFYSGDYSNLNHQQAMFRTLNFEKPSASFHYLLARDTIDEVIYSTIKSKKTLARAVLDTYRRRKQKHARETRTLAERSR